MDFYQDLNSASQIYREEALREARTRHLLEQAKESYRPRIGRHDVVSLVVDVVAVLTITVGLASITLVG